MGGGARDVRSRWYTCTVFPTTIWTRISEAGAEDESALEDFAVRYRPAVLEFIQRRGFTGTAADDLCQEVFLRVLRGGVLAKADQSRGRFRSLLLTVTTRVIQDRFRKRREAPTEDLEPATRQPDFDRSWALHLTERAMAELREQGSPYYDVLRDHLGGKSQNRNKLWIARKKLATLIRKEVAFTCVSHEDFEAEMAYLSQFLRPSQQQKKTETP